MNPPHIPGNEPDASDMSQEPGLNGQALHPDGNAALAEEDEAAKLGDFA